MKVSIVLRRVALVAATSSLLATVPLTAAHADGSVTNVTPISAVNTATINVGFDVSDTFLTVAAKPSVTFLRHADPTDTIVVPDASVTVTAMHVDVANLAITNRNPGPYDIKVIGKTASSAGMDVTDSCISNPPTSSCFTVQAFAPTVSSVSATTASGPSNTVGGGASGLTFTINGNHFTNSVYCSVPPCGALPTVTVSGSGVNLTGSGASGAEVAATTTTITKKITVDPGATPGPRDVVVTNTDGKSSTQCVGCLVIGQTPTLTSVTPNELGQGATGKTLVLAGTNFSPNATVAITKLDGTADATIVVGSKTVNSSSQITLANVSATNAPTGFRRVRVTNPDSGTIARDDVFEIKAIPTVSSVTYASNTGVNNYGQGALHRSLEVNGTGFQNGATVDFATPAGITVNGAPTVNSPTKITLDITLNQVGSSPPSIGAHAITVKNPDGGNSTATQNMTVAVGPAVNTVTPPSRGRGQTVTLTIEGTNFDQVNGVTVTIPDVTVNSATVNTTTVGTHAPGTLVTVQGTVGSGLNIAGVKDVTVLNNGNKGQYVCTGCFAVDNLQVDTVSPNLVLNDVAQHVTITGSGFASNAVATLVKTGTTTAPDLTGTNVTVNGAGTSLQADFATNGAAPGGYLVRVTNPTTNPGVGTCTCSFTVVAPLPNVTTVSPASRGEGAKDEAIDINGSDFAPGAVVTFSNTGVTVKSTTVTPTKITVVVDIAAGSKDDLGPVPPASDQTVTVTNTDGQADTGTFTVNAGPTAVSAVPNVRGQNTASSVTVSGTDLQNGATLTFSGTGVTAGPATFTDGGANPTVPDTLVATVTVAPDAAPGARTLTVRNPDGGRGTTTFTINVAPTVTSMTPVKLNRGAATPVTITGTGFATGVTVNPGAGVTAGSTVVNAGGTTITVTLTVAPGADLGNRDVSVTNTDAGTASKTNAYKVIAVPGAPTGVNATGGNAKATVTWVAPASDGGDPITSYTVTSNPGGKTATTADGSTLTADVTGLTNGTAYTFTVVATNAAGNSVASSPSNSVTPATVPDAPTGVTATAGNATAHVTWNAPVSNGGSALTGYTVTSSPGGHTAAVNGTTTAADVNGLTNGTAYTFTVVATNGVGDSVASAASNSVTPATVPDPPLNVSAAAGDSSAFVTWNAPVDDGGSPITSYTVTANPGGATATTLDGSTTNATVNGLTNGTAYTFTVTATNAKGTSAASTASPAVTPFTIPGAPTGVTATAGDTLAHVSWTAPSTNGGNAISGYTVTSTPGGFTKTVGGSATTADVTGLTNGTAYTFTVVATNDGGNGPASSPSNSVTPIGKPGAPTGVTAVAGHAQATVSWTAPGANGSPITGYTVTVSPGGATKSVSGTSTTVTGLTNGTLYTFAVTATNAAGTGTAGTSNAVRPTWQTYVSLTATKQIVSGGTASLSGTLTRSADGVGVGGQTVGIYAKTAPATTYTLVRSLTTTGTGSYATSFKPTKNTTYVAKFLGAPGFDKASSFGRLTNVAYRVTATWTQAGRTVTVKGSVSPSAAGRAISLRYKRSDGTTIVLRSGTVTANGTYTLTRTLPVGTYSNAYVLEAASTTNTEGRSAVHTLHIT
jgi:hypothetical protein